MWMASAPFRYEGDGGAWGSLSCHHLTRGIEGSPRRWGRGPRFWRYPDCAGPSGRLGRHRSRGTPGRRGSPRSQPRIRHQGSTTSGPMPAPPYEDTGRLRGQAEDPRCRSVSWDPNPWGAGGGAAPPQPVPTSAERRTLDGHVPPLEQELTSLGGGEPVGAWWIVRGPVERPWNLPSGGLGPGTRPSRRN